MPNIPSSTDGGIPQYIIYTVPDSTSAGEYDVSIETPNSDGTSKISNVLQFNVSVPTTYSYPSPNMTPYQTPVPVDLSVPQDSNNSQDSNDAKDTLSSPDIDNPVAPDQDPNLAI